MTRGITRITRIVGIVGTVRIVAVVGVIALGSGCGGAATRATEGSASPHASRSGTATSSGAARARGRDNGAADPLPSLDAIAARAGDLAPGLTVVDRGDDAVAVVRDLPRPATAFDACYRVAFAANVSVHAELLDADGHVFASVVTSGPVSEGAIGEHGPVCATRASTSARLRFETVPPTSNAVSTRVRWVAWRSSPMPAP